MTIQDWIRELSQLITKRFILNLLVALIIFGIGLAIARRLDAAMKRFTQFDQNQRLLFSRIGKYGIITIAAAASLSQMGFDLKVLLGAAGVLTVAIGFAAQTSASNLISGLFLMIEKPFVVGDVITVGEFKGEVLSIDLLSSKIRTFTNLMVRIPNEALVKSNIVNHSYFPIRRLDLQIGISYSSDVEKVEQILREIATKNPLCLDEPKPVFLFRGFGDSSMNVEFEVWTLNDNIIALQNQIYLEIKAAFDANGVDIPFPTRVLITSQTQAAAPIPLRS
jgi:small-conductance mechanosensitive channel